MSMNVRIFAERDVKYRNKAGKTSTDTQTVKFEAYQTPTEASYAIANNNDPAEAYVNWVLKERSVDEEIPIYGEDDVFGDEEPVGFRTHNAGKAHVEQFIEWCNLVEKKGYTVKFEVM